MSKTMLEVRELTTKYITRFHEDVYAVDHVSLKIEEGKSLGIAGESGCGKSTLALSLMVINEKSLADLRAGMDLNARLTYTTLGNISGPEIMPAHI